MLSFFIGVLTVGLVLDCLFLLLLILIQLPKKEAGLGQAFGSSTTDALFGAGSGNALTKVTKYSTVVFFILAIGLAVMNNHQAKASKGGRLKEVLEKTKAATEQTTPTTTTPAGATSAPTPIKLNLPEEPVKATNKPAVTTAAPPAVKTTSAVPAAATPPATTATNKPAAAAPAVTPGTNKPAAAPPK